jgi:hypothetical protein
MSPADSSRVTSPSPRLVRAEAFGHPHASKQSDLQARVSARRIFLFTAIV